MDSAGHVACSFMGTDPGMPHAAAQAEAKELDYEAMDREHRRLLKTIRDASNDTMVEPVDVLSMRATVPLQLDSAAVAAAAATGRDDDDDEWAAECQRDETGRALSVTVKLFLSYSGRDALENVALALDVPAGLLVDERTVHVPVLRGAGNQVRARVHRMGSVVACALSVIHFIEKQTMKFESSWSDGSLVF